jgi:hypothetical protein
MKSTAVGGKRAIEIYEGERRFGAVVRLPEALRDDGHGGDARPDPVPVRDRTGVRGAAAARDRRDQT